MNRKEQTNVTRAHRGHFVWWREDAESVLGGELVDVTGSIGSVERCGHVIGLHVTRLHLLWRDAFDQQAFDPAAVQGQYA